MTNFLNYLLEGSLILFVAGVIYMLLFREDHQLNFRRFFLLSSVAMALLIPLVNLEPPVLFTTSNSYEEQNNDEFTVNNEGYFPQILPEIRIAWEREDISSSSTLFTNKNVTAGIYLLILLGIVIRLLVQVYRIIKLYKEQSKQIRRTGKIRIVQLKEENAAFNFMNMIFFKHDAELSEDENKQILEHEFVHARQWHSIDNVCMEIICSVFWFHPIMWYFRREIREVHEYLADREVSRGKNDSYTSLLSKIALKNHGLYMTNSFYKSKTLNRIKMLNKINNPNNYWKSITAITLFSLAGIFLSCNENIIHDISSIDDENRLTAPDNVMVKLEEWKQKDTQSTYTYRKIDLSTNDYQNLEEGSNSTKSAVFIEVDELENVAHVILREGMNKEKFSSTDDALKTFPKPVNGYEKVYEFLANEMKYPTEAVNQNLAGRVYMGVIISAAGDIIDAEVTKGVHPLLDQEALRVIHAMDHKWEPGTINGTAADSRVVIPINFSLDKDIIQTKMEIEDTDEVFSVVEKPAVPSEGYSAFYQYVAENLTYPEEAKEKNIQGRVFIQFIIDTDGKVTNVETARGIHPSCDQEAVRIISEAANWIPAEQRGKAVKQRIVLPITFALD